MGKLDRVTYTVQECIVQVCLTTRTCMTAHTHVVTKCERVKKGTCTLLVSSLGDIIYRHLFPRFSFNHILLSSLSFIFFPLSIQVSIQQCSFSINKALCTEQARKRIALKTHKSIHLSITHAASALVSFTLMEISCPVMPDEEKTSYSFCKIMWARRPPQVFHGFQTQTYSRKHVPTFIIYYC